MQGPDRRAALARYLEDGESVRLVGLDDLVRAIPGEKMPGALIAVPQIGPFALAVALIARCGVKMATVFWQLRGDKATSGEFGYGSRAAGPEFGYALDD